MYISKEIHDRPFLVVAVMKGGFSGSLHNTTCTSYDLLNLKKLSETFKDNILNRSLFSTLYVQVLTVILNIYSMLHISNRSLSHLH